ncbi:MAG: hypothetical protein LLF89_03615 [Spirochaetaceae bacterium]|nr:hypothetical protein [Spirochaetaceae bacterium]
MGEDEDMQGKAEDSLEDEFDDMSSFLSPADAKEMLSSLEEKDMHLLRKAESPENEGSPFEDGSFISPEEIALEESQVAAKQPETEPAEPGYYEARQDGPYAEGIQADLLARIAGEVRSIKMELTSIKEKYDEKREQQAEPCLPEEMPPKPADSQPLKPESSQTVHFEKPEGKYIQQETLDEIKRLLGYLDSLLESLPEGKIDEFARSEYFDLYRKVFEFFGLV